MTSDELETMTAINLRDEAYYLEEAQKLQEAAEQGRHGGNGEEVEEDGEHSD